MRFKNYSNSDHEAVCHFLIELNRENREHINWNWGRFEWMMEHPEFDKSLMNCIGIWMEGGKVVGVAIYDMYFGEAFVGALPAYSALYPEILDYAYRELKDENGLGIAICDTCSDEISAAKSAGFTLAEQTETVMRLDLDKVLPAVLPDGLHYSQLDPVKEPYAFQWLLWQGFDHGTDRAEFEKQEQIIPQARPHLDPYLSVAVENANGEKVAYCCLWYSDKTDYAYVEPVCTVPDCRGKGIAKAVINEALNRAKSLGAKKAYVLSDMPFYEKLGFKKNKHFTFLWKK